MTLVSPCVWAEIFITQMKGKSGSWMVNGVEWADHLFFMLPGPFSTLPLLNSFPGGLTPFDCIIWVPLLMGFLFRSASDGHCRGLENGRRQRGEGAFPCCFCPEAFPLAATLPDDSFRQAIPSPQFPFSRFLCLALHS